MKALLMVASAREALNLEVDNRIVQNTGLYPPLGLLYVAAYLNRSTEHRALCLDAAAEEPEAEALERRIKEIGPDVIGLTAFTHTLFNVLQASRIARRACPEAVIVWGGPHLALYPEETLGFPEVDFAIRGDGERAFAELLDVLADPAVGGASRLDRLAGIEGLVYRTPGGEIRMNPPARITDLDSLPIPDRGLLPDGDYYCVLGRHRKMTTVISSRGCPFGCTFCFTPDRTYRPRSAARVVDELQVLAAAGYEEIFFFDDLFNLEARRVRAICQEILERGLEVPWAFRGRVEGFDDELAALLAQAGCERVQLGIEKASDEALERVGKGTTVQQIRNAVRAIKRHGMMCVGNFLLFTPGEDEGDADRIVRFALELELDHAEFNVFVPYPGTPLYEEGLRTGVFPRDLWLEYARDPRPGFRIAWGDAGDVERLYRISNEAHRRFYLRPRIIWNELRRIGSWKELARIVRGAGIILSLERPGR